jgi:hypothetical protein
MVRQANAQSPCSKQASVRGSLAPEPFGFDPPINIEKGRDVKSRPFSMAEREGFEPSREIAPPYRFSKPTPSATWVPLLLGTHLLDLFSKAK